MEGICLFLVRLFLLEVCASLLSQPNFDSLLFDDMLDSHRSLRKPRLQGEVSDKIGRHGGVSPPAWSHQVCWCQKHPKTSVQYGYTETPRKKLTKKELFPQKCHPKKGKDSHRFSLVTPDPYETRFNHRKTRKLHVDSIENQKPLRIMGSPPIDTTHHHQRFFPKSQTLQIIGSCRIQFDFHSKVRVILGGKRHRSDKNHHNKENTKGHIAWLAQASVLPSCMLMMARKPKSSK